MRKMNLQDRNIIKKEQQKHGQFKMTMPMIRSAKTTTSGQQNG